MGPTIEQGDLLSFRGGTGHVGFGCCMAAQSLNYVRDKYGTEAEKKIHNCTDFGLRFGVLRPPFDSPFSVFFFLRNACHEMDFRAG